MQGLAATRVRGPVVVKKLIRDQLQAQGWYVSTRFKVPSRGDETHYRGVLDLICWPPPHPDPRGPDHKPNPHITNRPAPVLVEVDRRNVRHKTRAKLAAFPYLATARVVILTEAETCDPLPGVDTIICLGA